MKISILPTVSGTTIEQYEKTWGELTQIIENPIEYSNKSDLPLIKLAKFGDVRSIKGSLRHDGNVIAVSGVEGDYDAGAVTIDQASLFLSMAGIRAILYTTPSNSESSSRWRVLVPFAVEYGPHERAGYAAKLNELLGGILARESGTLSQTFYFGKVAGVQYRSIVVEGGFIDTLYQPIEIKPVCIQHDPVKIEQVDDVVLTELESALKSISSDEHDVWVSVGHALSGLGAAGYKLWSEWSATSAKHKPNDDLWRWNTFDGTRTSYQAVFTKAQANGWQNPRAMKPVELTGLVFDGAVPEGLGGDGAGTDSVLSSRIDPLGFVHLTGSGKPQASVENLRYLLNAYGIKCGYDEMLKTISIEFHNGALKGDNSDNASLSKIQSLININFAPATMINMIDVIFNENDCNPVMAFIESKPWDGISRIDELCASITVPEDMIDYRNMIIRKWLIQCIAALDGGERSPIHHKIDKYELVLTFQGEQGIYKTTWVKGLLPRELSDYIKDGLHLDLSDKDSIKNAISCWIGELGELDATFRKSDISRLKAFLSATSDTIRMPYARMGCQFKRRTSYYASVNDDKFLLDSTGNRRYGALPVQAINVQHGVNMQQLWAEVLHKYLLGAEWWLNYVEQTQLRLVNETFTAIDPVEEMLQSHFDLSDVSENYPLTSATEIALAIGNSKPTGREINSIVSVLKKYHHKGHRLNYKRGYKLKKRLITDNINWND